MAEGPGDAPTGRVPIERRRASDASIDALGGSRDAEIERGIAVGDVEAFVQQLTTAEGLLQDLGAGELDAVLDPSTAVPILLGRAQTAILRSESRHRDLVERCPSLVVELAPDGTTLFANAAARRLIGRRLPDLVGTAWWEAVVPSAWRREAAMLTDDLRRDDVVNRDLPLITRDGELRWVEWTSANRYDVDRTLVTAVLFGLDVTEQRRAAETARNLGEERTARAAADAANRAKSDFLAMMSHELRTPLNAIAGHTQLLQMELHGPVTDAQRTALGRITGAQRHLLRLIDDVLHFAKLEAGRMEYDVRAVRLDDVVRDVATLIDGQLQAHGHTLEGALTQADVEVWADREKLVQILLNLLSNAIKFTPPGGRVTIDTPVRSEGTSAPQFVHLRIRDTGPGIPQEKLATIFEPFRQLNVGLTRTHHGTGLGLAISRDLAHGMGATLRARSEPGEGAAFTLTLRRVLEGDEELPRLG